MIPKIDRSLDQNQHCMKKDYLEQLALYIAVDHCLSDPCQHGVCVSGVDDFKCICSAGFRGTACDEPIDACSNNPCQHGQCSPSGTTFTCTCESGYSGNHCSISEGTGGNT